VVTVGGGGGGGRPRKGSGVQVVKEEFTREKRSHRSPGIAGSARGLGGTELLAYLVIGLWGKS